MTSSMESEAGMSDTVLLEAVDEGLLVLGANVRLEIFRYSERKCQVTREDIPQKMEAFHRVLESIFGHAVENVEKLIVKRLYQKLGLTFVNREDWTLVDYVDHAKKLQDGIMETV